MNLNIDVTVSTGVISVFSCVFSPFFHVAVQILLEFPANLFMTGGLGDREHVSLQVQLSLVSSAFSGQLTFTDV